jgi:hypothetical protein
MRYVGHVELMGEKRGIYRVWWKNVRERHHSKGLGLDESIILKRNRMGGEVERV